MRKKKPNNNVLIRASMKKHGLFLYELADIIGISEPTMCRWMRKELPEDEQRLIIAKIEDHAKETANVAQ